MISVKRYRIAGRVQGVGFRYFVLRRASDLGVSGWVRNMADGTVEAVVGGSDDQHRRFAEAVAGGPRWSEVRSVEAADDDRIEVGDGFRIAADGA